MCGEDKVNPMKNPHCLSGLESHMLCADCVTRHAMVQGVRVPSIDDIRQRNCLGLFQLITTDDEAKRYSSRDASAQEMSVRYPVC